MDEVAFRQGVAQLLVLLLVGLDEELFFCPAREDDLEALNTRFR